jgi:hypothetical protein
MKKRKSKAKPKRRSAIREIIRDTIDIALCPLGALAAIFCSKKGGEKVVKAIEEFADEMSESPEKILQILDVTEKIDRMSRPPKITISRGSRD